MATGSFDFIDAVVLYAIAWAGPQGANPEVLEPCFRHLDSLPTIGELNTAVSRLATAGLVRVDSGRVRAGQQAEALFESLAHLPARTIPERFAEFLSTVPLPLVTFQKHFGEDELRAAQHAYTQRRIASLRKPAR